MDKIEVDSEILNFSEFKNDSKNGDLFHVGSKIYDNLKLKLAGLLFLVFLILNSDIFIEGVLSKFISGTYDSISDKTTEKGIVLSAMILSLSYLFLDFLFEKKII